MQTMKTMKAMKAMKAMRAMKAKGTKAMKTTRGRVVRNADYHGACRASMASKQRRKEYLIANYVRRRATEAINRGMVYNPRNAQNRLLAAETRRLADAAVQHAQEASHRSHATASIAQGAARVAGEADDRSRIVHHCMDIFDMNLAIFRRRAEGAACMAEESLQRQGCTREEIHAAETFLSVHTTCVVRPCSPRSPLPAGSLLVTRDSPGGVSQ
jgi:hypothetical protein